MPAHRRLICALLAALGGLALGSPAIGLAAEGAAGSTGTTQTRAHETSSSISVSETPVPSTSTATPAPSTTPAPPAVKPQRAPAPKVRAQRPQRSTPGTRKRSAAGGAHANKVGAAKGKAGSSARPHGPRAPSPSALTPPLPLAFSSSLAGIPGFFIESFRIPPFLLPIYQAAGTAYGVPWQVLAGINEIETDYGRDLSVSSAGAEGWMQFLPSSWSQYGVDANGDGFKDPYNPADAIFAAARYLRAAGGTANVRSAIFAYNHSQAYVGSVMLRAQLLGGTP